MELLKIITANLFPHQFSSHKHGRENNLPLRASIQKGLEKNIQTHTDLYLQRYFYTQTSPPFISCQELNHVGTWGYYNDIPDTPAGSRS